MNQAHVAGHLGADPEVRFTTNGQKVVSFRLGAKCRRGGKDDTIWWRITVWGDQIDNMIPYLKKGTGIMVYGEMSKPEIFTNRDGQPQISMNLTAYNVSFSPFGKPERSQEESAAARPQLVGQAATQPMGAHSDAHQGGFASGAAPERGSSEMSFDDEIPF